MRKRTQKGMGIIGLLFTLGMIALVAMLVLKLTPVYIEYFTVKRAVAAVARAGYSTPAEAVEAFKKQASIDRIDVITARNLEISGTSISFAYDKKVPLFGNISLYIEFEGSSAKAGSRY